MKAFREYGSDLPGISSTGSTEQSIHSIQTSIRSYTQAEEGNDNDIEGEDVDFGNDNTDDAETESSEEYLLHNDQTGEILLPPHMPCCTHTLNLVCTTDASKALKDNAYKKLHNPAMAKCCALWNLTSRSTKAADTAFSHVGFRFLVPTATCWN